MAYKKLSASVKENSPKSSPASIHVDSPTTSDINTWIQKLDAITLGKITGATISETLGLPTLLTKSAPKTAQRGEKILVKGYCSVTDDPFQNLHTFTIPTANKIYIAAAGSDVIDMTQTDVAAFITATNAIWKNQAGKSITIASMEYVNRSVQ